MRRSANAFSICAAMFALPLACAASRPPGGAEGCRPAPSPTLGRVDEALDRAAPAFAACREADAGVAEPATLRVRLTVDERGHVVEVARDDDAPSALADCVVDVVA